MAVETRCPRCDQLVATDDVDDSSVCPYCGFEWSGPARVVVPPPPSLSADFQTAEAMTETIEATSGSRIGGHVAVPRFVIYTQGILLAVVAIVAFVLGAGFGGLYSSQTSVTQKSQVRCELRGRITRSRADGQEVGVEARVIVVPADRQPDERWPHDGLKPGQDVPPTDHPALVGIRVLGGAYVATNSRGEYRLRVPSAGQYYVLVLTEPKGRREVTWNKRDLAQVGRYFQDAMRLLGPCDYDWQLLSVTPDEQWSVVFQPH